MLWLYHRDVLDYLQQGSRDSRDIVKWRAPPTVGEMWSQPSEYLVCSVCVHTSMCILMCVYERSGCAIIGTIAIACDCCFTITIMRLIACYIFKSKLNISMIFL